MKTRPIVTCCNQRRQRRMRRGYILATILIFVLPLLLAAGLATIQICMLKAVQQRVHAAAAAAAESACDPIDLTVAANITAEAEAAFDAAGLILCHLGGDFRTEIEYFDTNADNTADRVQVAVTIPMSTASMNYVGLLCGGTANDAATEAWIRAVVVKDIP